MSDSKPYLDASVENGVLVLTIMRNQIEGEDTAAALKEEMLAVVTRHGLSKVVLDLQQTRYVSSIAFWPLLTLRRLLADKAGKLVICGLTGAVAEVFNSTKMVSSSGSTNAPFETAPDRAAAVARLTAPVD